MSFRFGVGKKIGGINFFLSKSISTSRANTNKGIVKKSPTASDLKDIEFSNFLHKSQKDANELIMDFFELTKNYYSFDRKGYHFVVLDANGKIPGNDSVRYPSYFHKEQLEWLEHDLKTTPLPTIVFIHQGECGDTGYTSTCWPGRHHTNVFRAGCNSPPAVGVARPEPASASGLPDGQQIRSDAGADGHSPDERRWLCTPGNGRLCLFALRRFSLNFLRRTFCLLESSKASAALPGAK